MGGIPNIGPGMRLEHDAWALTRSLGAPGAFAPRFSAAGVRRRRPPIPLVAAVMNVSKEATPGVSLPFVLVSLPVHNDNGLHLFSRWESRRMRMWRARRRKEGAAERCPLFCFFSIVWDYLGLIWFCHGFKSSLVGCEVSKTP